MTASLSRSRRTSSNRHARAWPCARLVAWLLIATWIGTQTGAAAAETGLDVMRRQRELQQARDEETALRMTLVSKSGDRRERRIVNYVLTGADHLSKTLLRFLAPRDVENTGLLTWERPDGDDDQWLYLPAVGKVKRIVSSGKKTRFMGSDLAYEDLRPENLALHRYTLERSERVDGHDCFLIEAVPATPRQATESGYSKRRLWIRQDIYLTVRAEYTDTLSRLEKVAEMRDVVHVRGSVWRPNEFEMRSVQLGTRTVVHVERRRLDQGLPETFFTQAELIRGRP
jgi:hypothetical protein